MNKRRIMTLALSICMVAILAIGGSLAYLTDTDNKTNVFTVGNVQIEQFEKDRDGKTYENDKDKEGNDLGNKKVYPIVDDYKDSDGRHMGKNYIDKIVTVENTGNEEAYVRTFIAIPAALDDGPTTFDASLNVLHFNVASASDTKTALKGKEVDNDWYWGKNFTDADADWPEDSTKVKGYVTDVTNEDGTVTRYNVYIATHKSALSPDDENDETAPCLMGVYFDTTLDYGDITDNDKDDPTYFVTQNDVKKAVKMPKNGQGEYTWNVLVASQAVQTKGFDDAFDALAHAFGDPDVAASDKATATTDVIPEFTCPFGGEVIAVFPNAPVNP